MIQLLPKANGRGADCGAVGDGADGEVLLLAVGGAIRAEAEDPAVGEADVRGGGLRAKAPGTVGALELALGLVVGAVAMAALERDGALVAQRCTTGVALVLERARLLARVAFFRVPIAQGDPWPHAITMGAVSALGTRRRAPGTDRRLAQRTRDKVGCKGVNPAELLPVRGVVGVQCALEPAQGPVFQRKAGPGQVRPWWLLVPRVAVKGHKLVGRFHLI